MCWVAVERAVRVARQRGLPADLVAWTKTRDEIYRQIMEKGWNEERGVRAALRLGRPRRVEPAHAAREVRLADRSALALDARPDDGGARSDTLVYRYNVRASPDGVEGDEGRSRSAPSGTWRHSRAPASSNARIAFEKMLTYANHLGYFLRGDRSARGSSSATSPRRSRTWRDQRGDEPRPPARLGGLVERCSSAEVGVDGTSPQPSKNRVLVPSTKPGALVHVDRSLVELGDIEHEPARAESGPRELEAGGHEAQPAAGEVGRAEAVEDRAVALGSSSSRRSPRRRRGRCRNVPGSGAGDRRRRRSHTAAGTAIRPSRRKVRPSPVRCETSRQRPQNLLRVGDIPLPIPAQTTGWSMPKSRVNAVSR